VILYDAARCPYCARARIVLAEKGLGYETVEIDLSDRPGWIYAKNPSGKVPVLEEDGGFVLPESLVIMEYLEERFPEPPLWPFPSLIVPRSGSVPLSAACCPRPTGGPDVRHCGLRGSSGA